MHVANTGRCNPRISSAESDISLFRASAHFFCLNIVGHIKLNDLKYSRFGAICELESAHAERNR